MIEEADHIKPTFRKSNGLFAIRQFLKEVPQTKEILFNHNLRTCIDALCGNECFVVKSIYFDKPGNSNWFVAYHQDLTIAVDKKVEIEGFSHWTVKHAQYAVQPPAYILENNFTIRIHLDETNQDNGALKVVAGSHLKGVQRRERADWRGESETFCAVQKGGIMIMKPLLLHASHKTTSNNKRRVIHIEFSSSPLPLDLEWAEKEKIYW
jgi:ectoine hydroxylase-related dioxygenase (phytanoyl-CoA dioxygenase family)